MNTSRIANIEIALQAWAAFKNAPKNEASHFSAIVEKAWLVTGTPGGSTIINTVLQLIVNVVDFNLNVEEATHQPRIFQDTGKTLRVEPNFNPDTVRLLGGMGHSITSDETMGSAQSIMIENGYFLGAADPRRPGALAVPAERPQPKGRAH